MTREASPNNIAVFAQYISELGSVEDHILSCFKHGGGVPYSEYRRFHEIMAEDSGQTVGPLPYTISCMHCMSVSLEQNGAGLGAMWGEEKAREMLSEAGFSGIRIKQLPHDFQNYFYIMKKVVE